MVRFGMIPTIVLAMAVATGAQAGTKHWVSAWADAQMAIEGKYALTAEQAKDLTLRQMVRITVPGERLRIRLSNAFGTVPLVIGKVSVTIAAAPNGPQIEPGAQRPALFDGWPGVVIAPGSEVISDPVDLPVMAQADLAISLWQADMPAPQTGHIAAHATSYLLSGEHVDDAAFAGATVFEHWYELAGVDVETSTDFAAIAIVGDSITDGTGIAPNSHGRWSDVLARRLKDRQIALGVVNMGIGGNRVLKDGNGPSAVSRLERDVFGRDGIRYLIICEGVNDLGTATRGGPIDAVAHAVLVDRLEKAYADMAARARAQGLTVIGATIGPFGGSPIYPWDAATEADRQVLNAWIRAPGHFDAVIDFDAVLRDPATPEKQRVEYDSGDHLHPAPGYLAMGNAVDLDIFVKPQKAR